MAREHVQDQAKTKTPAVETTTWGRRAIEASGYLFLIWAIIVAGYVYAFDDPAARAVGSDSLGRIPMILTHVPRNIALFFALLLTMVAMIAPGDAVMRAFRIQGRDLFERIAFGTAAGMAVLTAIAYFLATIQQLRAPVEWVVLLVCLAWTALWLRDQFGSRTLERDTIGLPRFLTVVLWILLGAALYVALLAALTPEVGFDARYYHLTQAERYAQHGGFYNLVATERIWAFALPHYQETLYAFQYVLFGQIGAKLFAWGDAVATVLALIAFARIWFGSTAIGLIASVVLFASPVVAWSTTTANNDLAAVPFVILALHALVCWYTTNSRSALSAAGVFAGFTYGIKTFGGFTLVAFGIVIAVLMLRRHIPRKAFLQSLAVFAGCGLLAMLPALITAQWMVGDPIFPLAPSFFRSEYGAANMGDAVSRVVVSRLAIDLAPAHLLGLPWTLTVNTLENRDLVGPIWLVTLPLWLLLAIFGRRRAEVIRPIAGVALAYSVCVLISGAVEFRYFEPILPVLALLIGYAIVAVDWRVAQTLRTIVIACIVVFSALDNGLFIALQRNAMVASVMGLEYLNWSYLYEGLPETAVQLQYVPILVYVNDHLDPNRDRIYDAARLGIMNLYSQIELYNGTGYASPGSLNEWALNSSDAYAQLQRIGCTYVILNKTDVAGLRNAPIWSHLRFVVETPSMDGPAQADDLFKITG